MLLSFITIAEKSLEGGGNDDATPVWE